MFGKFVNYPKAVASVELSLYLGGGFTSAKVVGILRVPRIK